VVGLTAGASAPEVLVEDVIDALRRIKPVTVSTLDGIEESVRFRLPVELSDENLAARAAAQRVRERKVARGYTSQASRQDR
jgi:4-hydroxy-3-methylbut-2-enyl diphosphate reductase